ncbi:hypothetical protein AK812_SmicGene42516 [Symbiodinium microadriaticum]|uniref:Uncharacterized protein n=1 Tax=Symbiodinium microadriaticum TaxID=2951 RepID=A0A1Q9C3D3_SYMMI|nr:hypothetical protein AK812_SmicGene42516 [Symbiodinium microadriaticum]
MPASHHSSEHSEKQDIEEITSRLRDCSVSVRFLPGRRAPRPASPAPSSSSFTVVSASEVERAGVPLAGSVAGPSSPDLALDSAASLAEFDLGHLSSLASGLGTAPVQPDWPVLTELGSVHDWNRYYICLRPGMANRPAVGRAVVREEDVRALLATDISRTQLPPLLLCSDDPEWRALVFLLQARAGGFAIAAPSLEDVAAALAAIADEETGESLVLTVVRQVESETSRRRATGPVDAILADVPWSALTRFRRAGGIRLSQGAMRTFTAADQVVRPLASSALEVFRLWLAEVEDDDSMREYVTAEEEPPEQEEEEELEAEPNEENELVSLRQRLAELERRLQAGSSAAEVRQEPLPLPARTGGPGRARELFAPTSAALSGAELQTLREAAGVPPARLGRAELVPREEREEAADLLAEDVAGVKTLDEELAAMMQSSADPLQKLLAAQTLLLQKLAPKPVDPLSAALQGGGGNEPGSSTGGVRGHTAREAFLKQLEDHASVAKTIRENACQELGVSISAAPPGLMREFLDKKVALHEHKTLGFLATFLAYGWQASRESSNVEMEAFCGRGLMAIEQMILDGGRLQIGWLLTGLPEPVFPATAAARKGATLRPFSKLCKPAWAASCLAYVKDLDYMEGRLKAARETPKPPAPTTEADASEARPKAKWKPKKPRGADASAQS